MRAALALVALLLLLVVTAGCGEDEPKRSQLAEQLAALCDQARPDIEALGLPGDKGFAVVGRRLRSGFASPGRWPARGQRLRPSASRSGRSPAT